jgi:Tol biopolymer transport system component
VVLACVAQWEVTCSSGGLDNGLLPDRDDEPRDASFELSSGHPAWSPDGNTIVFTYNARTATELEFGTNQLWLYSVETHEVLYVAPGDFATWSPSGEQLAYTLGSTLCTVNLASGEMESFPDLGPVFEPRWSPTRRTILFVRRAPSPSLWTMEADGGHLRQVGVDLFSADWSPNGRAFVCTSASLHRLMTGTFSGIPPDVLVDTAPAHCVLPRWAPDGAWIAYHRTSGGLPSGLWLVRPDGTEAHEVIRGGGQASWSPDGTQLVYESRRDGSDDATLWLYSARTRTSRALFGQ